MNDSAVAQTQSKLVQSLNVVNEEKILQGLRAADQGNWELARQHIAQSRDPVAAKMYYWLLFQRGEGDDHFIKLVRFIRNNPQWPGMRNLRHIAEDNIPENFPDTHILAYFKDYPAISAKGISRHLQALRSRGYDGIAAEYLNKWWRTSSSSVSDQEFLYRIHKDMITQKSHKERLNMLLYAKGYTNARAIAKILGGGYPRLAEARIALAEEKKGVNGLISQIPAALRGDIGLMFERLRWRRRSDLDESAVELLSSLPDDILLHNASDWWRERHILIRRYLERGNYQAAYDLARTHKQRDGFSYAQAEWMAGWLALRFMNRPLEALHRFEAMHGKVYTPISKARAAYWAGRALKQMGHDTLAHDWFEKAGQFQTVFYGQLAAAELQLVRKIKSVVPPRLTEGQKRRFLRHELVRAAKLFNEAGMRREASRFLRTFTYYNVTPEAYKFAADLSMEMNQYHDTIRIAKDATSKGLFLTAQSYPVIADKLEGIPVEWALIHSLIRQESMFDYEARSPVGARGLMQIMPATAKEVARKLGVRHETAWLTQNVSHNIMLGSDYLRQLLVQFEGSYPLAIAAYNAGPSRVERWLKTYGDPRLGEVNLLDWVELIPIYETRNYVHRVMEGVYVYRLRLEGVQRTPNQPLHVAMQ